MNIGIISDFNAQNLAVLIEKRTAGFDGRCQLAPFGQTMPTLLNKEADFWSPKPEALLVWTFPQLAVGEFASALDLQPFSEEQLMAEVDLFAAAIRENTRDVPIVLVPTWVLSANYRSLGVLDFRNGAGIANILSRMNLRLADHFSAERRIVLLDTDRWFRLVGAQAYNPKLWYRSKTPFSNSLFAEAARDIEATLTGLRGKAKKVVILDLDNTLWGGVLGDLGAENVRLGGHDAVGEAFRDFQHALKRLARRGVLLAIASKNEEALALEMIEQHPEMVLRSDDFAGWRINWNDKGQNIVELLADLNLGLDAAVFIDDSAFERGRIREALPDLVVPELPSDVSFFATFLDNLNCFDSPAVTAEDRNRTSMYVADRKRKALKLSVPSMDDWLKSIQLEVSAEPVGNGNLDRATQLLNKTNQMNLRTRRLSSGQFAAWTGESNREALAFRVIDRFGDYGLCGLASIEVTDGQAELIDFVLSCRVMGRAVEGALLAAMARISREKGCRDLKAEIIPTPRNQPCRTWFEKNADSQHENSFSFNLSAEPKVPSHIELTFATT